MIWLLQRERKKKSGQWHHFDCMPFSLAINPVHTVQKALVLCNGITRNKLPSQIVRISTSSVSAFTFSQCFKPWSLKLSDRPCEVQILLRNFGVSYNFARRQWGSNNTSLPERGNYSLPSSTQHHWNSKHRRQHFTKSFSSQSERLTQPSLSR